MKNKILNHFENKKHQSITITLCKNCFKESRINIVTCLDLLGIHKCENCKKDIICKNEKYYLVYRKDYEKINTHSRRN